MTDLLNRKNEDKEIAVPKDLETQFKELMNSYLFVLSGRKEDPIFSVMGFITSYAKLFWWEINIFPLPFIVVINVFIFILNKIRQKQINYIPSIFLRYLKNMHQSLRRGEVPALKFFTAKFITNLFIQLHIKKRLKQINRILSIQELKNNLLPKESPANSTIQIQKGIIKGFDNIITPGLELKFLISFILPFFGIIKSIFHMYFEKFDFTSYFYNYRFTLHIILNIIFIFLYLLNLIISCFIRKREIFLESDIYQKERAYSTLTNRKLGFEFPLDLIGWIVIVMLLFTPYLFNRIIYESFLIRFITICVTLYCSPFVYALVKRIKLKLL